MRIAAHVLALLAWSAPAWADPPVDEELEVVTRRIDRHPTDVDSLLERSELYLEDGELDDAWMDLAYAEAVAPGDARVRAHRAAILHHLRRNGEALAEIDASLERAASFPAYALRARILVALGRPDDAVADYDAALSIADEDVELHLERGRLLERANRLEDAARGYERALEALHGAATVARAAIELELRRGHPERALAIVDAAIAGAPAPARWWLTRARCLDAMGRVRDARREREQALADVDRRLVRRPSAALRVDRGEALLALGRIDEAAVELRRALLLGPSYGPAIDLAHRIDGARR